MTPRKILHIDMDAFFAAVEQRDHPQYRGQPIVVGSLPAERGVVAAASYEARHYGIHSAMPSWIAAQRCQHLIFVKPRFEVYKQVSNQIQSIFQDYTDLVEPLALDEAYLDVTCNHHKNPSAVMIAHQIRQRIWEQTRLTASAGVSLNKFLAKIASGVNKPNGLCLIAPQDAAMFVAELPIEKFPGIGKATAARMHGLGIRTGAELKRWSEAQLMRHFGKVGAFYYKIARGEDQRPVNPDRSRYSIGVEQSFIEDLASLKSMCFELEQLALKVKRRLDQHQRSGQTLTLKIKYADYQQITRSRTMQRCFQDATEIFTLAQDLLLAHCCVHKRVRLLGITISKLEDKGSTPKYEQLCLLQG